jgi:hypothetical protein
MVNPSTLPALGGALLAAVVLGIHLGESAVGLIDPIHFQGPAVHPRDRGAAIDPNRVAPRRASYADLYGWEEGDAALTATCDGCGGPFGRAAYAYSAEVPYFGGGVTAEPEPAARYEPDPKPEPREAWAAREEPVARYAHYPVSADERPARRPARADRDRRPMRPDYAAHDVYLPPEEEPDSGFEPGYSE